MPVAQGETQATTQSWLQYDKKSLFQTHRKSVPQKLIPSVLSLLGSVVTGNELGMIWALPMLSKSRNVAVSGFGLLLVEELCPPVCALTLIPISPSLPGAAGIQRMEGFDLDVDEFQMV